MRNQRAVPSVIFFTSTNALDIRTDKECRALLDAGFRVTVVAPSATDRPADGIELVSMTPASGGRLGRIVLGNVRLLRLLVAMRADVYHFHDPELLPLALLLRAARRRVVYDAYENVRDDIRTKPYLGAISRRVLSSVVGALEWVVVRSVNHVIAATPTLALQFPPRRTTTIHNYPIIDELDADFTFDDYVRRSPHGSYVGAMTPMRQAREMFEASDKVHEERPEFALVTAGPTFGIEDPGSHPGVDYRSTVPREAVPALIARARFGISLLADEPHLAKSLPTKVYEYAAAGLPVIVSRSNTTITSLLHETRCGLIVDETDPSAIAEAMTWILDHPREAYEMGRRGATAVRERYQWANEAAALVARYRALVGSGGPNAAENAAT
ncbi:MAG: glycosyltransferase [Acidimicrobiia bacterium]